MPSLRDIRRRIASVKNTQQITNAMKMVSAAKLQRAQDRVVAARPYSEHLQQLIVHLDARVHPRAHPLLTPREEGKTLLVVVTSDRGLCGGFNANVQRAAAELVRQLGGNTAVDVIAIGKKGRDFLTYRRIDLRTLIAALFGGLHLLVALFQLLAKRFELAHGAVGVELHIARYLSLRRDV